MAPLNLIIWLDSKRLESQRFSQWAKEIRGPIHWAIDTTALRLLPGIQASSGLLFDRPQGTDRFFVNLDLSPSSSIWFLGELEALVEDRKKVAQEVFGETSWGFFLQLSEEVLPPPLLEETNLIILPDRAVLLKNESKHEMELRTILPPETGLATDTPKGGPNRLNWIPAEAGIQHLPVLSSSSWNTRKFPEPKTPFKTPSRGCWPPDYWEEGLRAGFERLGPKAKEDVTHIPPQSHRLGGICERSLVSTMQGYGEILEGSWALEFQNGRLERWKEQQRILAGQSRSWIRTDKGIHHFQTVSSFSLEGPSLYGMRESLQITHELFRSPARLVVDYFFLENLDGLCISLTLRIPKLTGKHKIKEFAPLEIPIYLHGGTGKFGCADPNGDWKIQEIKNGHQTGIGTRFFLEDHQSSFSILFPQEVCPSRIPIQLSTKGIFGKKTVSLNLGGSYQVSKDHDWSEKELHLNFLITPGGQGDRKSPSLKDKKILAQFPRPYLISESW